MPTKVLLDQINKKFAARLQEWSAELWCDAAGICLADISADPWLTEKIIKYIQSLGFKTEYTEDDAFCYCTIQRKDNTK